MTHILDMYDPSRFVQPHELNGKDVTVTIARVVREEVKSELGESHWPVMYFSDHPKPLRLGRKMGKQLIRMFKTTDPNVWVGKRITLYAASEKVQSGEMKGEMEDRVRIRKNLPPQTVAKIAPVRAVKSLSERVEAFRTALKGTTSTTDAEALWAKGAALRGEIDADKAAELELEYEAHIAVLREKEK